jgi:hypothetical protein
LYIAQDLWKSTKSENPFLGERGKGGVGAERTGKSQVRICKESTWGSDLVSRCMHVAFEKLNLEERCGSKVA